MLDGREVCLYEVISSPGMAWAQASEYVPPGFQ
jgi:hypothetical protein